MTPRIVDVIVAPDTIPGLGADVDVISVRPVWDAPGITLDRPIVHGWSLTNRKLVPRLVAALRAGVVYDNATVATDVDGNTYVAATSRVLGRKLSADLKRLGY